MSIADKTVNELRAEGCVVVIFTAGELDELSPIDVKQLEDDLITHGNDLIDAWKEQQP